MIKAVICDIGGVIIDDCIEETFQHIADRYSISLQRTLEIINELRPEYLTGKITSEYWEKFSRRVGKEVIGTTLWTDNYRVKPRKELINFIASLPIETACLSNIIKPHVRVLKEMLFSVFDHVILSCEVGMKKPDEEIYYLALKRIGVPPKNCLYIDDKEENLIPAKKLGMQTILAKNEQQTMKEITFFSF